MTFKMILNHSKESVHFMDGINDFHISYNTIISKPFPKRDKLFISEYEINSDGGYNKLHDLHLDDFLIYADQNASFECKEGELIRVYLAIINKNCKSRAIFFNHGYLMNDSGKTIEKFQI